MLQQWNMEGVKFYLLYNNFIKKFSFEKIKKSMKGECKRYLLVYNLSM